MSFWTFFFAMHIEVCEDAANDINNRVNDQQYFGLNVGNHLIPYPLSKDIFRNLKIVCSKFTSCFLQTESRFLFLSSSKGSWSPGKVPLVEMNAFFPFRLTPTLITQHKFPTSALPVFLQQQPCWHMSEGTDCIVVTSQHHRSPDGLFKGTVSEFGLCAFIQCFKCFDTVFVKHQDLVYD